MAFLLYGDIMNTIYLYYLKHGHGITIQKAAELLIAKQKVRSELPQQPDFSKWDTTNLTQLKELSYGLGFSVDEIHKVETDYAPQSKIRTYHLRNRVQISTETEYNTDEYVSLPYITVIYILKGKADFFTEEESMVLHEGDLLILPEHLPFRLFVTKDDIALNIVTGKDLFQQNFTGLLSDNAVLSDFFHRALFEADPEILRFYLPISEEILDIIRHLFIEFTKQKDFYINVFLNYLQIFYAEIFRNGDAQPKHISRKDTSRVNLVSSLLMYIQANYRTVTLQELAEQFHYTPAYLSRLIHNETKMTLNELKTQLKMKTAKDLLHNTALSIEQISELSGYNSADHFTHIFKKETGIAPSLYRKQHVSSGLSN